MAGTGLPSLVTGSLIRRCVFRRRCDSGGQAATTDAEDLDDTHDDIAGDDSTARAAAGEDDRIKLGDLPAGLAAQDRRPGGRQ